MIVGSPIAMTHGLWERRPGVSSVARVERSETRGFRSGVAVPHADHLHAVIRLPEGDDRYSMRWRMIKTDFTVRLRKQGIEFGDRGNGERDLWARRFWEHTIRDQQNLVRRIDYLHFNPVKHGYVRRVADWPHSSFHSFVSRGLLPADWAGSAEANNELNGE